MTDFETLQLFKSPGVELNSGLIQKKIPKGVRWDFFYWRNFMLCKTKKTALASLKQQQAMAHLLTILQVI